MLEITGMLEMPVLMVPMIRSSIVMTEKVEKEKCSIAVQPVKKNLVLYPLLLSLLLYLRPPSPIVAKLEVNGMMEVVTTMKT